MSYSTPLMNSTEDNNQEQKMAKTKVPSVHKLGSASKTVTEQTEKLESKKISVPSLDKSGSASKTETEQTKIQFSISDDKKLAGLDPKDMRIKIFKSAHDDKSYWSMSVSLDIGHIPRKKQKKYLKLQSQGIK